MHRSRLLPKLAALIALAFAALVLTAGAASAQDYDPCDGYDPGGVYDGYDGYDPPDECVDETTTTTTTSTTAPPATNNVSGGGSGLPNTGGVAMVGFGVALAAGAIALRRMNSAV